MTEEAERLARIAAKLGVKPVPESDRERTYLLFTAPGSTEGYSWLALVEAHIAYIEEHTHG